MAKINGTNITAPVAPFTTDDIYPTHYAEYGKGGYRTVETVDDLNNIPAERKEEGMLVYVKSDSKIYKLKSDNTWEELSTGCSEYTAGENITIDNNSINAFKDIISINKVLEAKTLIFEGNKYKYPNTLNLGNYDALGSTILGANNTLGNATGNTQNCIISGAFNVHNTGNGDCILGMRNTLSDGAYSLVSGNYNRITHAGNNGSCFIGASNYGTNAGQSFIIGCGNTLINNTLLNTTTMLGQFLTDRTESGTHQNMFLIGNFVQTSQSNGTMLIGAQSLSNLQFIKVTGSANATTLNITQKSLGHYDLQQLVGLSLYSPNLSYHRNVQMAKITKITDTQVTFDKAPFVKAGKNYILYLPHTAAVNNSIDCLSLGKNNYFNNTTLSTALGIGHKIIGGSNKFAIGNYSDTTQAGTLFIGDGTGTSDRHNFIYGTKDNFTIQSENLRLETHNLEIAGVEGDIINKLNKIDTLDDKISEIQLYKTPNVTIFGEPTINNGQISDFTANDYIQFPFLVDLHNKSFEINICLTTGSQVINQENIFDSDNGLAFAVRNGKFVVAMSSTGQSWDMGEHIGTTTVLPNTTYYVKISWDRLQYKLDISTDKTTYTNEFTYIDSNSLLSKQIIIGKSIDNKYIFSGSINLNNCTLSIMGQMVWQGMDNAGIATRLATDLHNIDSDGEEKVKEIIDNSRKGVEMEITFEDGTVQNYTFVIK